MTPSPSPGSADDFGRTRSYLTRATGLILLLLVAFPFYRMAAGADSDRIAADIIEAANVSRSLLLLGTLITLTGGILLSKVFNPARLLNVVTQWLASLPLVPYAIALAVLSGILCLVFSVFVLEGKPNLVDAMVQLTQARYVAAGRLGGPADPLAEFWHLPNSIGTPNGWVSQYPPGYVVLLALGMVVNAPVVVGPVLVAITVFFTTLTADRLFPGDRAVARFAGLALALSPFLLGLAGAYMNHIAAAAFISIAIYCAVRRADRGSFLWAIICGAAVGATFTVRPLTAVVAALVVATTWVLWTNRTPANRLAPLVGNSAGALIGAAPFVAAVAAYNKYFFGSALRFGYSALVGPLVNPGFHRDPSGHMYGPLQALEYTSSDLTFLSMYLLESPIPACVIVGLFLVLTPRLSRSVKIVAVWALLPVLANAFYWHHGFFMGPRMLHEWTPAWVLLTAVAATGLIRMTSATLEFRGYSLRTGLTVAFLLAWLAGVLYLGPQRLARYGGSYLASTRLKIPRTPLPSLIFVHGGWSTRIAMRLAANGMRADSLEAALALNPTCDVQVFADWYASPAARSSADRPTLNFDFGRGPTPERLEIARGDEIRYFKGQPFPRRCVPQVVSDTLGIIDISPLAWQGDLPGLGRNGAMIVRDMGPAENARLIARYPDRVPMIMMRRVKEGPPELVSYEAGIMMLWPNG